MRSTTFLAVIAVSAACLFAQETAPSNTSAKRSVRMFDQAQYDSVLSLVPGADSLRRSGDIIGVGRDTITRDIVVICFDRNGNPAKSVFPESTLAGKPGPAGLAAASTPAAPPEAGRRLDQRGRTWFIIESALKSSFVYPFSYRAAFPHADGGVIAGASLLTIGGTLYGTFAFTRNLELGYGRVGLMNYGSTLLGLHYPLLLGSFLHNATGINKSDTVFDSFTGETGYADIKTSDRVRGWFSMLGFPIGIYLGSRLNIVDRNDGGKMTLMGYFSQPTAYLLGYGLPFYFINPAEDRRGYFGTSALLTMALMPAGCYAGYKIAGREPMPAGRGALPYVTGIMGGLTGLYLPTLFDLNYNKISTARMLVTTTLAGYGGGTALGLLYQPSKRYTYWQTVFIGASSVAGALMVSAFPLIGGVEDNHKPYVLSAVFGGWTGFFLGDYLSSSLFEKSGRDRGAEGLRVNIPGLAALPFMFSKGNNADSPLPALPVADLEWRF
jgi:hypothetical protein